MYKHFIAVTSVYTTGMRIAWHYSAETLDLAKIQEFLRRFKKKHGDTQLGIHRLSTESSDWKSVVQSDSYFKEIASIPSADEFIQLASADKKLTALDISKFILSFDSMTHLKLQKILYLCYEKFLKLTGESLFEDEIYAWKYGPVVKNVYDELKTFGQEPISYEEDDHLILGDEEFRLNPSMMRMVASEHGTTAISVVNDILKEYADYDAWDLVDLTHEKGKPWDKVYNSGRGQNKQIVDDIIIAYS